MKKNHSRLLVFSTLLGVSLLSACGTTEEKNSFAPSSEDITSSSSEEKKVFDYRFDRDLTTPFEGPDNLLKESELPKVNPSLGKIVTLENGDIALVNDGYRLDFVKEGDGYCVKVININHSSETSVISSGEDLMFANALPVRIYLKGSNEAFETTYERVEATSYGVKASKTIHSSAGSILEVTDCYYIAKEAEKKAFNMRQEIKVVSANEADTGFGSDYCFASSANNAMEWFIPNVNYRTLSSDATYIETYLGAPMAMMRDKTNGNTLSLARYQPKITYTNNCYATFQVSPNNKSICVSYPSHEANRKYHDLKKGETQVYEIALRAEKTESYDQATIDFYNCEFNLQNQRIVNTDIDEVYRVINEDYKTFLHEEEQEDEESGKKYTSYGLPWRITIEDGEFGPMTYQAGFIGQQIPSAYNMMLYGISHNDLQSLQNGINVINFWVEGAEMMSVAGVPHIWYDTWSDSFRAYPCFTRMAIDAMEGLLDAYRLAVANGISVDSWREAIDLFGDFLVNKQNEDGSYYRCYNYDGGPFVSWDNGIEEPPGNICQSTSTSATPMPIRFLAKMYEMTGDESYKEAALKAGEYVYQNIYNLGYYYGGTCDNANAKDKEAGVYAMYAYDALYTLTGDAKWLSCLQQAAAFTMSTVMIYSFEVKKSTLKSAYPLNYGYNDGMSFIACHYGSGVDNYASFIYYELFRIYIMTGNPTYLKQAEFIQQNTKSIMNWDGALNYKYKSLVAEASSISSFTYSSASDGAWVTWSSFANVDPISKMLTNFGHADVMYYADTELSELRTQLSNIGVGGKEHKAYPENTVVSQLA